MALFGKKKKNDEAEENVTMDELLDDAPLGELDFEGDEDLTDFIEALNNEQFDEKHFEEAQVGSGISVETFNPGDAEEVEAVNNNETGVLKDDAEDTQGESGEKKELTPEEAFRAASTELCHRIRMLFPQQMVMGLYHGELSSGDYVDDFCCYVNTGELIERDEIPSKCGMSYADMVSREDKLMQAFFKFRKAAEKATDKKCSGATVTILGNGQAKLDITTEELTEEGEEERFAAFREIVVRSDPKNLPPRMTKEQSEAITQQTAEIYQNLGTEFFSFLPETEFKKAYFYCEITSGGAFYYHRMVLEDGTILDGDALYERFEMDADKAEKDRMEIVRLIMNVRQIFVNEGQKPFSSATLTVTPKGEFRSFLGFAEITAEGEIERLEEWKAHFNGTEVME